MSLPLPSSLSLPPWATQLISDVWNAFPAPAHNFLTHLDGGKLWTQLQQLPLWLLILVCVGLVTIAVRALKELLHMAVIMAIILLGGYLVYHFLL